MAGSRLEKIGTVYTRVRDLLSSGVIKPSAKPIWFHVCEAFPPNRHPVYVKPHIRQHTNRKDAVPEILYIEDTVRAKFYQVYGAGPRAFDLFKSNSVSTCQRFVEKYTELKSLGEMEDSVLFEQTGKALLAEGIRLRRRASASMPADPKTPQLEMKLSEPFAVPQTDCPDEISETDQIANCKEP